MTGFAGNHLCCVEWGETEWWKCMTIQLQETSYNSLWPTERQNSQPVLVYIEFPWFCGVLFVCCCFVFVFLFFSFQWFDGFCVSAVCVVQWFVWFSSLCCLMVCAVQWYVCLEVTSRKQEKNQSSEIDKWAAVLLLLLLFFCLLLLFCCCCCFVVVAAVLLFVVAVLLLLLGGCYFCCVTFCVCVWGGGLLLFAYFSPPPPSPHPPSSVECTRGEKERVYSVQLLCLYADWCWCKWGYGGVFEEIAEDDALRIFRNDGCQRPRAAVAHRTRVLLFASYFSSSLTPHLLFFCLASVLHFFWVVIARWGTGKRCRGGWGVVGGGGFAVWLTVLRGKAHSAQRHWQIACHPPTHTSPFSPSSPLTWTAPSPRLSLNHRANSSLTTVRKLVCPYTVPIIIVCTMLRAFHRCYQD